MNLASSQNSTTLAMQTHNTNSNNLLFPEPPSHPPRLVKVDLGTVDTTMHEAFLGETNEMIMVSYLHSESVTSAEFNMQAGYEPCSRQLEIAWTRRSKIRSYTQQATHVPPI